MGTLPSLHTSSIPEYDDGIRAVRTWTIDWLYEDLHPYTIRGALDSEFLTTLMRMISLGSTFDLENLRYHLPQVRSVFGSAHRPQELLRANGRTKTYVVADIAGCISGEKPTSLISGIRFIK